jgi:hypothetical protein
LAPLAERESSPQVLFVGGVVAVGAWLMHDLSLPRSQLFDPLLRAEVGFGRIATLHY